MTNNQLEFDIKVIAVCGKSNVGKTSSILIAADSIIKFLREAYGGIEVDGPHNYGKRYTKDKWYIITIKGKRIAIFSRGDGKWWIEEYMLKYAKDCDYYICASHLSGETIDCLINSFDKNEILFINKVGLLNRSIREYGAEYESNKDNIDKDNSSFAYLMNDLFIKFFKVE